MCIVYQNKLKYGLAPKFEMSELVASFFLEVLCNFELLQHLSMHYISMILFVFGAKLSVIFSRNSQNYSEINGNTWS